jgi:hypothetical protein
MAGLGECVQEAQIDAGETLNFGLFQVFQHPYTVYLALPPYSPLPSLDSVIPPKL